MRLTALLALGSILFIPSTVAAKPTKVHPEIINWGGTAFSWPKRRGEKKYEFKTGDPVLVYDVVSALDEQTLADADCSKWSTQYKGATWCFASAENLATFKKSVDEDGDSLYEPLFGGRCALGTSWGHAAATGDPRTFEVIEYRGENRLVLQSHNKWREEFRADFKLNVRDATQSFNIHMANGVIVPNADLKKGQ